MKVCSQPGCPTLTYQSRCPTHTRARDKARGSRQARGYDQAHVKLRAHWAPLVHAGAVKCWRCGEYIKRGDQWDLGHDENNRAITRGPEHALTCNRSAAGKASHPNP